MSRRVKASSVLSTYGADQLASLGKRMSRLGLRVRTRIAGPGWLTSRPRVNQVVMFIAAAIVVAAAVAVQVGR